MCLNVCFALRTSGGDRVPSQSQSREQNVHIAALNFRNPNCMDQAKAASRDALQAQEDAQEAMKRAYMKQMTAQQKAVQASQQASETLSKISCQPPHFLT